MTQWTRIGAEGFHAQLQLLTFILERKLSRSRSRRAGCQWWGTGGVTAALNTQQKAVKFILDAWSCFQIKMRFSFSSPHPEWKKKSFFIHCVNLKNEYQVEIIHEFDTWGYNYTEPTVKSCLLFMKFWGQFCRSKHSSNPLKLNSFPMFYTASQSQSFPRHRCLDVNSTSLEMTVSSIKPSHFDRILFLHCVLEAELGKTKLMLQTFIAWPQSSGF